MFEIQSVFFYIVLFAILMVIFFIIFAVHRLITTARTRDEMRKTIKNAADTARHLKEVVSSLGEKED